MQGNSVQHKEVSPGPRDSGTVLRIRYECYLHLREAVLCDDDIGNVSVSVEVVVDGTGNLILEKGGCFLGITFLRTSPTSVRYRVCER